jgi:hypothetical protein
MARSLTLNFYQDPGHGWARVPLQLLDDLGIAEQISSYSYMRGAYAYLEEDCDLSRLLGAAQAAGLTVKLREFHTNNQSKIRGYRPYLTVKRAGAFAAAHEAMIKARIQAQGCSAEFINNNLIVKVIS